MINSHRSNRSLHALTAFVLVVFVLSFSQLLAASKKVAKDAQARVIFSGQFKGHVEPCG